MLKQIFGSVFLLLGAFSVAQQEEVLRQVANDSLKEVATVDMYKIYSLVRDTAYVDTSLTIKSDYRFNYLRKDNFGLMPFANVGQTYNRLQYGLIKEKLSPDFGFHGKHFNYLEYDDVAYYHVPTPYTELYYRSVMEQGQNIDALFTVNPSESLNFSIAYKGLRSIGKYINVLSSTGNFRFTTSYRSKNKRYIANAHVVYQDIFNAENGGIKNASEFEGGEEVYKERGTLDVNLRNASTMLKGNRFFLNHHFQLNKSTDNKIVLSHQSMADKRYFQYVQTSSDSYFGTSYVQNQLDDRVDFRQIQNSIGLVYDQSTVGETGLDIENRQNNYYYTSVVYSNGTVIPSLLSDNWWFYRAYYQLEKKQWNFNFDYQGGVTDVTLNDLNVNFGLKFWESELLLHYQMINRVPDYQYRLNQSNYTDYNWVNNWNNERSNKIGMELKSPILDLSLDARLLMNKLYFSNDSTTSVVVTPKQYAEGIGVVGIKVSKEIIVGKFAWDNTVLCQQVKQSQSIVNLPEYVVRSSVYYSDYFFKKALFMQVGFTGNYFSEYYSDVYNPLIGSFYVQQEKMIGNFPMIDFFVNAKVRTARLYLKAEHFNSSFAQNNFYSDPTNPYRDFVVRFGIIWSFFN